MIEDGPNIIVNAEVGGAAMRGISLATGMSRREILIEGGLSKALNRRTEFTRLSPVKLLRDGEVPFTIDSVLDQAALG